MCEPDCADEWLQMIWGIGCDYDGYSSSNDLKDLIDELVEMSKKARECLRNGKIFSSEMAIELNTKITMYLKMVRATPVWDRVPAISDAELDAMLNISQ